MSTDRFILNIPRRSGKSSMIEEMRESMLREEFNKLMIGEFDPNVLTINRALDHIGGMECAMKPDPLRKPTHFTGFDPASPSGDKSCVVTWKSSPDGRYIQPTFHFATGDANPLKLTDCERRWTIYDEVTPIPKDLFNRRFIAMTNDTEAKAPKPLEKMTKAELLKHIADQDESLKHSTRLYTDAHEDRMKQGRRADTAEREAAQAHREIVKCEIKIAKLEGYIERVAQIDNAQFHLDRNANVPGDKLDQRPIKPFGTPGSSVY